MKNLQTFEEFLLEYQKYSDYGKGSWATPDALKIDVILAVRRLIPVEWDKSEKEIKSVEDISVDDKGIKFDITLKSGDVISAFKIQHYKGSWEWYLNKKKMSNGEIYQTLEDKIYSAFDKWKRNYDMTDNTSMYSDDPSVRKRSGSHDDYVSDLYKKLSSSDKKKADDYMKK